MHLTIALLLLFVTLLIGVPVPFSFGASVIYLVITLGYDPSFLLPVGYSKLSAIVLLAIPLFIMAGGVMEKGRIGGVLTELAEMMVRKIKGGLGVAAVVSCAIFGSISGSAAATLSCIGTIMLPKLDEANYPKGHAAALVANAAPLGLLIPPSSIQILYAWVGNQSVLACFLATVIPGIMLVILLSLVNVFLLRNNTDIEVVPMGTRREFTSEFGKKTIKAGPALLMPIIILGGIYSGIMTPTEAAAISVIYAIPVGFFIYKGLNRENFFSVFVETATTTGVVMVMLFIVMILSRLLIMENLPTTIMGILTSISENKYILLILINVFMVIIGMIMDDTSGILLCTPILLPVVSQLGIDPIHFAAIIGVNLGMGNITPPTAPLLYLGARVGNTNVKGMLKPTMYMILFAWLPVLIITTYIPNIALFLPRLILGH